MIGGFVQNLSIIIACIRSIKEIDKKIEKHFHFVKLYLCFLFVLFFCLRIYDSTIIHAALVVIMNLVKISF